MSVSIIALVVRTTAFDEKYDKLIIVRSSTSKRKSRVLVLSYSTLRRLAGSDSVA